MRRTIKTDGLFFDLMGLYSNSLGLIILLNHVVFFRCRIWLISFSI